MKYLVSVKQVLISITIIVVLSACEKNIDANFNAVGQQTAASDASVSDPSLCGYDYNDSVLIKSGWTKTFEDNFSTDLSKWNIWNGGAYNNELQHYQSSNLVLANGVLQIVAKNETVTGNTDPGNTTPKTFNYTSGRIESKTMISANTTTPKVRLIARIKIASGYGMWPAFWSYGDAWPTNGEIDVLEARGNEPYQYETNYFYGRKAGTNLVKNASKVITTTDDLTACYHVYEMEWTKDALTSYLDGKLVEVKTSGGYISSLFGKRQRLALNLAVGGAFFYNLDPAQIQTGTMYIDWVKVFTSK